MGDENPNAMNLGLNLGIAHDSSENHESGSGSYPNTTINSEDSLDGSFLRIREVLRQRRQLLQSFLRQLEVLPGAKLASREVSALQIVEGSVAAEERPMDVIKTCDDNGRSLNDEALAKKNDEGKCIVDSGSFFDCRICLDVAKDPVLTCCGHLFCWPCLYRWLHVHSVAKECPVCKGEVTIKNLTPINGRAMNVQKPEINYTSLKIPLRPQARRVESWRQAIRKEAFTGPLEEMVGRLGRKFDMSRVHLDNAGTLQESPESSSSLLNRFLTSRGMRREENNIISPNYVDDVTESSPVNTEVRESQGNPSLLLHRSNSNEAAMISHLTSSLDSAERLVESDFPNQIPEPLPVDNGDNFSNIAAEILSENQTLFSAAEIDSLISFSSSSSRRRNDASRMSDLDNADLRASRRRRLG